MKVVSTTQVKSRRSLRNQRFLKENSKIRLQSIKIQDQMAVMIRYNQLRISNIRMLLMLKDKKCKFQVSYRFYIEND